MALDLKIEVYKDDACENLLLEDTTGLYSTPSNTGGYNNPNRPTVLLDQVDVVITLTYTQLSIDVVFDLFAEFGTITSATATLGAATPVNILPYISTVWPPTSANPFNLTDSAYSITFPTMDDGVYTVTYYIHGDSYIDEVAFTYTTTANVLVDCATCCCISNRSGSININDTDALVANLVPMAYMKAAEFATANGDITNANLLINKAAAICAASSTDCGC